MPKRKALLTREHIQTINKLCSSSISVSGLERHPFEMARQNLVSGFLVYLQEWQPDKPVDDSARVVLVDGLLSFAAECRALSKEVSATFDGHFSLDAAIAKCLVIVELLQLGMKVEEVVEAS